MIEFTEGAAYVDMFRAAPTSLGLECESSDLGVALFAPKLDVLLMNRVLAVGLRGPASRPFLDKAIARYRETGVRNFGVQLSPEAQPPALSRWLEQYNLHPRDNWTKVYRDQTPTVEAATDLRIDSVSTSGAERFGSVACEGFRMPPSLIPMMAAAVGRPGWHHYMAWDGDMPAATAALFVQGEVGWLGVAATLPAFRRRGAQGALMIRRIADGRRLGCRWFVTETGQALPDKPNPSFNNMLRTGFRVAYHRPNYMIKASPSS